MEVRGINVCTELALANATQSTSGREYAMYLAGRMGAEDARMGLDAPPIFNKYPELLESWQLGAQGTMH